MNLLRFLLMLYPASWRAEYGYPMYSDLRLRLRRTSGFFASLLFLGETIPDLLLNAIRVQGDVLWQDLRYTVRALRRSPAFTATAIAIAALGIAATTAAFTLVNHVFLSPLPYADPGHLVKLREDDLAGLYRFWETSPANFRDWKRMSTSFTSLGAYRSLSVNLSGVQGDPERLDAASLTSEIMPILGVSPVLGRTFNASDDQPAAPAAAVLSYGLWQERFAGRSDVLGRTMKLDNLPYTIIGVMPRGFYFPDREPRFWTLMRWSASDFDERRDLYIFGLGRLKAGVSLPMAQAEMRGVGSRLAQTYPKELAQVSVAVHDLRDAVSARTRTALATLLGAALCVLLIACTNLANLLLARAAERRRELAVRTALGAGRERLVRQVLTESIVLAIPGGALGLLLAQLTLPLLIRLVPASLPIAEMPALDARVLLFAVFVTFATGISFGIVPALRQRVNAALDLHEGGRSGTAVSREKVRAALVTTEIACSVVLLVGFGLLTRALWRIQSVSPGFRPDHVLTLRTQLPMPQYEKPEVRDPFYRHVLEETRRLPGVAAAAYTSFLPMVMGGGIWPVEIEGHPEDVASRRTASLRFVTPGFFNAMNIPLLDGRDVGERDSHQAAYVALVSESFVRRYWPGENPVGRHINIGNQNRTVIGIVGDIRNRGLERVAEPQVYASWQQPDNVSSWYAPKDLVVRTTGDPASMAAALRRIIHEAASTQPVSDIRTLTDVVQEQTESRRLELSAIGIFGAVALLLAAIGIHALLAFTVSQRRSEIGVRMALGAKRGDILSMTLREGLRLAAVGIFLGCVLAYGAGCLLESLLAGIRPWDVEVFTTAIAVALAMTLAGSLLPAIRAVRIDPVIAMRAD